MDINIPKVIVPVSMVDYAPELDGKSLYVWVNPPMAKLNAYGDLVAELQVQELESARNILTDAAQNESKPSVARRVYDELVRVAKTKKNKANGINPKLLAWYAEVWSHGPQNTRWTVHELETLEQQDPAFLSWMISQTWRARADHIERKKKA